MRKYLEMNENVNTTLQDLWDKAEVLRGKYYIAVNKYIKNGDFKSTKLF
jgi:hypothetical protein